MSEQQQTTTEITPSEMIRWIQNALKSFCLNKKDRVLFSAIRDYIQSHDAERARESTCPVCNGKGYEIGWDDPEGMKSAENLSKYIGWPASIKVGPRVGHKFSEYDAQKADELAALLNAIQAYAIAAAGRG